jgi:DNA-binding transcriptional LysR family regulator
MVVVPGSKNVFSTQAELAAYLTGSPFIFFNKAFAPGYNEKLVEICERMGFRPEIVHEANNVNSILQLVEAGLGVSILPSSLQQQYRHLNVNFVALKDIQIATEVVLAYKPTNKNVALTWFVENYNMAAPGNKKNYVKQKESSVKHSF